MSDQEVIKAKIDEYRSLLNDNPKSTVFVALSDALRRLGDLDDALEAALKGTWERPDYAEGFAAVGRVYSQRGVGRKAEEAFGRALATDQMCMSAYKGLARLYKDRGDLRKASDILTKAIMLDPDDTTLQQMLSTLTPAVAKAPQSSPSSAAGEDEGADSAPPSTSAGMKPITTATIAEIYIEQGLYDKALEVYRELLSDRPDDPSVQQKIAELDGLIRSASAPGGLPSAPLEEEPVAEEPVRAADAADVSAGNDAVIMKLNGWLQAIQARRNRV